MPWFDWLLYAAAAVPLAAAYHSNRSTSLVFAVAWAWVAWVAWGVAGGTDVTAWDYCALALTACAGVAVFGARWPGAAAWNFVVVGLLAVLALPLAEGAVIGTPARLGTVRLIFLAVTIGVTVLNYVPTRLGGGAALVGLGCGWELYGLTAQADEASRAPAVRAVLAAPWAAWGGVVIARLGRRTAADRLWLAFRDRFGLVWGQRLRDQFNRAASHAAKPVHLSWTRLRQTTGHPVPTDPTSAAYETLAALMKRFGLP